MFVALWIAVVMLVGLCLLSGSLVLTATHRLQRAQLPGARGAWLVRTGCPCSLFAPVCRAGIW